MEELILAALNEAIEMLKEIMKKLDQIQSSSENH